MKVLHLAPLWFPVSRDAPGGIETLLAGLLSALEQSGCRNTVIGTGDSRISGDLIPVVPRNLYAQMGDGVAWEYQYYEQQQLLLALEHAPDHDVIHSHIGPSGYALDGVPSLRGRVLHTQHNPVTADLVWFVRQRPHTRFTTVSRFQVVKLLEAGVQHADVIPNGVDFNDFPFQPQQSERLAFVGRIEPEKGPDLAVSVARELGWPLDLAGPIVDGAFFQSAIEPHLGDRIRYLGVADHSAKVELLGRAGCALMPSRWDEPFGMVAVESMACGTPVVALGRGGLPDVIDEGVTGFVATEAKELPTLARQAAELDRVRVRTVAAGRYALSTIACQYRDVYLGMVRSLPREGVMDDRGAVRISGAGR